MDQETLLAHWPFVAVAVIFAVIGQVTSLRVFTKARAYAKGKAQWFWWWGRETLPLHPIAAGAGLGWFWRDPEGVTLSAPAAMTYFAFAGGLSMVVWVVARGVAKDRGLDISLPGESKPPEGGA